MKKLLLLTLLCISINGFAFNWKKVAKTYNGNPVYIDVNNIKKHNGLVYYWLLGDWLEPDSDGVNSAISKYKVDCVEEKQTLMNLTFYSQSMGKGKIISEGNPNIIEHPKPESVGYLVRKLIISF